MTKLRDDNYYKWSYEMRMNLQSRGLWKNCENDSFESYVIEMKKKQETEIRIQQSINEKRIQNNQQVIKFDESKEDQVMMTTKEMMEWMNDEKCVAIIGLCLSDRL